MLSVAIVEDNAAEAENLALLLKRYAEEVGEALRMEQFRDGLSILDRYKAEFDIVFLDIEMPQRNGMTVAELIRQTDEDVSIVFVTHLAQYAIQGYDVRASGYFLKPTRYHDLKMCVDRIRRQKLTSILTSISTLAFENRGAVSRFFGIEAAATGELTASNVRYKTDFSEDGVPTEESAKASADALLAFLKRGNEERKK